MKRKENKLNATNIIATIMFRTIYPKKPPIRDMSELIIPPTILGWFIPLSDRILTIDEFIVILAINIPASQIV
jgi:hypothetical protein